MAVTYNRKDITLAIDPGYDATKICINKKEFKVPNNAIDITGQTESFLALGSKDKNFIVSHYIKDREYLLGALARKSTSVESYKEKMDESFLMMSSYQRFGTDDFEVSFMSAIGIALINYAKETVVENLKPMYEIKTTEDPERPGEKIKVIPSLKDARIIVGVTLPNDVVTEAWAFISRFLIGQHSFKLELPDGTYKIEFKIKANEAMPSSQVICAFLGAATDDKGYLIKKNDNLLLKNLPALVIDGGYKTVGIFVLTDAHQVTNAESNEEFSMINVHKEIARKLREEYGRTDISPFNIPTLLEEKDGIIRCLKKNKDGNEEVVTVSIKEMIKDEEIKICNKLIEYLSAKYNNLLDFSSILITGGTGAAYYNHFKKFIDKERKFLSDTTVLTDYEFNGNKISPEYAIAIGMYKTLTYQLQKAYEAEEKRAPKEA